MGSPLAALDEAEADLKKSANGSLGSTAPEECGREEALRGGRPGTLCSPMLDEPPATPSTPPPLPGSSSFLPFFPPALQCSAHSDGQRDADSGSAREAGGWTVHRQWTACSCAAV